MFTTEQFYKAHDRAAVYKFQKVCKDQRLHLAQCFPFGCPFVGTVIRNLTFTNTTNVKSVTFQSNDNTIMTATEPLFKFFTQPYLPNRAVFAQKYFVIQKYDEDQECEYTISFECIYLFDEIDMTEALRMDLENGQYLYIKDGTEHVCDKKLEIPFIIPSFGLFYRVKGKRTGSLYYLYTYHEKEMREELKKCVYISVSEWTGATMPPVLDVHVEDGKDQDFLDFYETIKMEKDHLTFYKDCVETDEAKTADLLKQKEQEYLSMIQTVREKCQRDHFPVEEVVYENTPEIMVNLQKYFQSHHQKEQHTTFRYC